MTGQFTTSTTYFLQEGRDNLRDCLRIGFEAALQHKLEKLVIFTSEGFGVRLALDEFCSQPKYGQMKLVAVTFPAGKPFTDAEGTPLRIEVDLQLREELARRAIPIVRAHLPFDAITPTRGGSGVLGQDLSLVENES